MSINRYLPSARYVAALIPNLLDERGLKPLISRFVLTETEQGTAWLFVVLDASIQEYLEDYAAPSVLEHLSTALHGLPVVLTNSRYAVRLSPSSTPSDA